MRPDYPTLFFDLDGTLTDSGPGIINSVLYALGRFGIGVPDRNTLRPFIGPPLMESFQKYAGLSEADARLGVGYYREYFRDRGIFENAVYPGIPALLAELRAAGKTVVMATGKPEQFAQRIADHFGLTEYFTAIVGATMDETRTRKADVIRCAMERCGLSDPKRILMIGDRENDVMGAAQCGMDCLGVLYGYGSRQELEAAGAAGLAETVEALRGILLRNGK